MSRNVLGLEEGRGLLVRLIGALPVPDIDVPLEDILDFKAKRQGELDALRNALDEVYLEAQGSADRPLAEFGAVERVSKAARDTLAVSSESGFKFRLADVEAKFNLLQPIAGAILGSQVAGLTGALLGGLAGMASLRVGPSLAWSRPSAATGPYAYVASYHKDVFPSGTRLTA